MHPPSPTLDSSFNFLIKYYLIYQSLFDTHLPFSLSNLLTSPGRNLPLALSTSFLNCFQFLPLLATVFSPYLLSTFFFAVSSSAFACLLIFSACGLIIPFRNHLTMFWFKTTVPTTTCSFPLSPVQPLERAQNDFLLFSCLRTWLEFGWRCSHSSLKIATCTSVVLCNTLCSHTCTTLSAFSYHQTSGTYHSCLL